MHLNIKNDDTYQLAAELAGLTGETLTATVTIALRERLERVKRRQARRSLVDELDEIALHCASLPVLDTRSDEAILGYDEHGLPH
ncbi:type II toxin-antitoxin system VapB family antitoxin [Candidatus Entotheonella palauensis]|uniref:type II toxin-antitoxin system VapB family antitoxin n=1 Tax=Candidatus Entotheonella palauensis TaxID=93172 RepID=UPI000B7C6F73|nr:type II toxin-antitoxin system VapB family antitoxin [Candidatus Entotheonella palauensis]